MFGSYLRKKGNIRGKEAGAHKTIPIDTITAAVEANDDPVSRYVEDVAICGSPEKVIDDLQELQETMPLDYLMIAPLSHSSFVNFTEKVLPKFL